LDSKNVKFLFSVEEFNDGRIRLLSGNIMIYTL